MVLLCMTEMLLPKSVGYLMGVTIIFVGLAVFIQALILPAFAVPLSPDAIPIEFITIPNMGLGVFTVICGMIVVLAVRRSKSIW